MPTSTSDLEQLFHQELKTQDEELRRSAALSTLHRLRLSNRITVEQFLADLQRHKDLWAVASSMGILDLAAIISGSGVGSHAAPAAAKTAAPRRTRLSEDAKGALKLAIVRVLTGHTDGLSRTDCAHAIFEQGLMPSSVEKADLAEKLRQPLAELVEEGRLHTIGQKRLMRYRSGSGPKKK